MSLMLHDGAASGHMKWTESALAAGVASGAIMSPFFTPRTPRRGQCVGKEFADRVRAAGGTLLFDATTHAVRLPGADNFTSYNTWDLWDGPRGDLTTESLRQDHLDRVFAHQTSLGVRHLAPTVALDSAVGADADVALSLAEIGSTRDPKALQSLAGRRGLWLSSDLDDYVGALAQLRAPGWLITPIREIGEYPPGVGEVPQIAALCRTVHSMSERAKVLVCQSDLFGLPAVAAGAQSIGTGWHTKQRICSPATYQKNDPDNVRRTAVWYTYSGLMSRIHTTESEILRDREPAKAAQLYVGALSAGSDDIRNHHLGVVQTIAEAIQAAGDRRARIAALRALYETAAEHLNSLASLYGSAFRRQRVAFVDVPYEALRLYAETEGLWA